MLIKSHQHSWLFEPVICALIRILAYFPNKPWVRWVREPWSGWRNFSGGRLRWLWLGSRGRKRESMEISGRIGMLELTGTNCLEVEDFFAWRVQSPKGDWLEMRLHSGYEDPTLIGSYSTANDPGLNRRLTESRLPRSNRFGEAIETGVLF